MSVLDEQILCRSPLDLTSPEPHEPQTDHDQEDIGWVPSRFNVRTVAEDGRMVLWNTFRGSLCILPREQADKLQPLLKRPGFEAPRVGAVEYLADRGFIIPEHNDEEGRVRQAISQQRYRSDRLELILLASEDCNFRCKYCYEDFARGTMRPEVRTGIRKLVENQLPRLTSLGVSWFGGEPLYGFEAIEELAPFFATTCRENGLAYNGHMTTNGLLLTPEVADKLLSWGIDSFQITIDGPPDSHNASRPARNGAPTFQRIFDNLCSLKRREDEFHVNVRINFDRDNVEALPEFVDILSREFSGDSRYVLQFFPVDAWGGEGDDELALCGIEEREQAQERLRREAHEKGLRVATMLGRHRMGRNVCYAARPNNFIVGAGGQLMKCTILLDSEEHNVVGRITEDGSLDLDQDKLARWTLPIHQRAKKCRKCVFVPLCQGSACPRSFVERGEPKCIGARRDFKTPLLDLLEYGGDSRTVTV